MWLLRMYLCASTGLVRTVREHTYWRHVGPRNCSTVWCSWRNDANEQLFTHSYPVYTIEQTSSRHRANVQQTSSKHRANIEQIWSMHKA